MPAVLQAQYGLKVAGLKAVASNGEEIGHGVGVGGIGVGVGVGKGVGVTLGVAPPSDPVPVPLPATLHEQQKVE